MRKEWSEFWYYTWKNSKGILWMPLISLLIWLGQYNQWNDPLRGLVTCFMYGAIIYSSIWLHYFLAHAVLTHLSIKRNKGYDLNVQQNLVLGIQGAILGYVSASWINAQIRGYEFAFSDLGAGLLLSVAIAIGFEFFYAYKFMDSENQKLQKLLARPRPKHLGEIGIKSGHKRTLLPVQQIQYFKSEDHYTFAVTQENEFILDESLGQLIKKLDPDRFKRIHRSTIVNQAYLKELIPGSNMKIVVQKGDTLPVARSSRQQARELFEQF